MANRWWEGRGPVPQSQEAERLQVLELLLLSEPVNLGSQKETTGSPGSGRQQSGV